MKMKIVVNNLLAVKKQILAMRAKIFCILFPCFHSMVVWKKGVNVMSRDLSQVCVTSTPVNVLVRTMLEVENVIDANRDFMGSDPMAVFVSIFVLNIV